MHFTLVLTAFIGLILVTLGVASPGPGVEIVLSLTVSRSPRLVHSMRTLALTVSKGR